MRENADTRIERTVALRRRFKWRGIVGGVLCVPTILTLFSAPPVAEGSWLQLGIDAGGWAMFVAGAGLRFWATLYIGGRKDKRVVTEGPYSICRHPLYLGSLLLALATALFLESLLLAACVVLLGLYYIFATIPIEEQVLLRRFGCAYDDYRQRVPRLWPAIRHFRTPPRIELEVHALRLECARAARWIWLPALGELATHLRHTPWWPHLFRLL